jgi:hypothetical protein
MLDITEPAESADARDSTPESQCTVFEWMDTDLWQLHSGPFRSNSMLPRTVAKSALEALVTFSGLDGVHTDISPNNVFVSGIHNIHPEVKLGDLGNCTLN